MAKVIYEPHPVSAERRQELIEQGYKIIDARFAPDDYVPPDGSGTNGVSYDDLTIADIKVALDEQGIEYSKSANKEELFKLLNNGNTDSK